MSFSLKNKIVFKKLSIPNDNNSWLNLNRGTLIHHITAQRMNSALLWHYWLIIIMTRILQALVFPDDVKWILQTQIFLHIFPRRVLVYLLYYKMLLICMWGLSYCYWSKPIISSLKTCHLMTIWISHFENYLFHFHIGH